MSEDQEETMPVDYELEMAFQQAKELLSQYPAATDGSEDRLERHAAFTLARLAGKLQDLRETLRDLVDALDACEPGIEAAFMMQQIHGGRYTGPTYSDELEAAKAAL